MTGRRSAALLCAVGGVVAVVAGAAGWVSVDTVREVGGVEVAEAVSVSGSRLSPLLVPVAVATVAIAALVAVTPTRLLPAVAGIVLGAGLALVTVAALGWVAAARAPGAITAAPAIVVVAGLAVLLSGVLVMRSPRTQSRRSRYGVDPDERHDDAEWDLAADERRS